MHFNALSVLAFAAASNAVILDSAKVIGTSTGRITKYLGIPYAKSPWVYSVLAWRTFVPTDSLALDLAQHR